MTQIRLLGGVGASDDDGHPIDVGPAKCQALLAALALSPGTAVPVDRLVSLVWGEQPPRTAEKTLQTYVTRLRRALGAESIERTGAAYRLRVDPDSIDAVRFQHHLAGGRIGEALAEWVGPPLAGLDAPGLVGIVDGLTEQWLGAVETDLERAVERDPASSVAALTAATVDHPFREGLWALLMTALYRTGRQADALAAYQRARSLLVEELGVEPGPRLRDLEASILGHAEPAIWATRPVAPTGNLPRRPPRLFGRDDALRSVTAALADGPVVTLVGPGGIGKTSLALAAAQDAASELADGAFLVELADADSAADVATAVADVLDVIERAERRGIESIVAHLRHRELLLVLDNCEHVIDATGELVAAISAGCVRVTVLSTSREALGVTDEQLLPVGPLAIEGPAVDLFVARAHAANPSIDLTPDLPTVTEICQRLDGVPLAIELAAARVTTLTPQEVVARLDDRLRLLTAGRRRAVERHRTLRATIQWSYDLLTPRERSLFRQLSVFAGTFDLAAVEAVARDDPGADRAGGDSDRADGEPPRALDDVLHDLVGRSMVAVDTSGTGRRFRLLETIRQFSAELLADTGDTDLVAARHARYVAEEAAAVGVALSGRDEVTAAARLVELWPNIRAGVEWALAVEDRDLVASIIEPLAVQMFVRRGYGEVSDWVERLLAMTTDADADLRSRCLLWAALHHALTQDRDRFRALVDRYGDTDEVLVRHANLLVVEDDPHGAIAVGPEAAAVMRSRGHETMAQLFDMFTGAAWMMAGEPAEATATLERSARWFEANGPPSMYSWALFLLGTVAAFDGDAEGSEGYWTRAEAVEVPPRTNSPSEPLSARSAARRGRYREAAAILRAYITELIDTDYLAGVAMVGIEFVNLMVEAGRPADAAAVVGHFDVTGLLGVEGPGFKQMIADAVEIVAANPAAQRERRRAVARQLDERGALDHMARVLDDLLIDGGTGPGWPGPATP